MRWASLYPWNADPGNGRAGLLAGGLSVDEVLQEMPALEKADVEAALRFASRRADHPIVAA
jgi:uncharacterized protein (DUF433 family)